MHVTVDLNTHIFPGHFETTVLHHCCRTSREITLFIHVNVDLFHTHQVFDLRDPIIEDQELRPNPNASELLFSRKPQRSLFQLYKSPASSILQVISILTLKGTCGRRQDLENV